MRIFKRIEVWLLLILIGGAVWFVMQPSEESGTDEPETATGPAEPGTGTPSTSAAQGENQAQERFTIDDFKLVKQEGGGAVLEIEVINNDENSIDLSGTNAVLTDEEGEVFDRFFLPFDAAPILEGADSTATLKFWMVGKFEAGEGKENFMLEIDGENLPLAVVLKK